MTTLFDLTYRTARELPRKAVVEGIATGGSVSTLIDTNDRNEVEHYWKGGSLWVLKDAGGLGGAPEGEYGIVSAFAASTHTVTLRASLTVAIAIGDRYALCKKKFPLQSIIQKVNIALQDMGTMPVTDTTTITMSGTQTEYSLPIAANLDLVQVWEQTSTATSDNAWRLRHDAEVQKSATGTADVLVLKSGMVNAGYKLKLVYFAEHTQLTAYNDKISEHISPERVIYKAAALLLQDKNMTGEYDGDIAKLEAKDALARAEFPLDEPKRTSRLMNTQEDAWGSYPGDRTPR